MTLSRRTLWRGLALLATLYVVVQAALFSASYAFQARNPELALKLDPDNPEARVRLAERWLAGGNVPNQSGEAVLAAARRAIADTPLNAPAFRLFATTGTSGDELARFEARVAMSDRLSRRDLATQLFLIEAAVQRGNIAGALQHYDVALRIRESSRGLLYPVLANAIRDPRIRQGLQPYLEPSNPWIGGFLRTAVGTAEDGRWAAALLADFRDMPEDDFYAAVRSEMISRLVGDGQFAAAITYFRGLDEGEAGMLTDLSMRERTIDPTYTPISWQPFVIDGIESMFLQGESGAIELFSTTSPGYAGAVAQRLVALPPGRYEFAARMSVESAPPGSFGSWRIDCGLPSANAPLMGVEEALGETVNFSGQFVVPDGCGSQLFTVSMRAGANPRDMRVAIAAPQVQRR